VLVMRVGAAGTAAKPKSASSTRAPVTRQSLPGRAGWPVPVPNSRRAIPAQAGPRYLAESVCTPSGTLNALIHAT